MAHPVCPDGKVRCPKHNVEAILRTSHTQGNYNRKFWACPLRPDRDSPEAGTAADCKFFHWENELPGRENLQPGSSTPASPPVPLATPQTPSRFAPQPNAPMNPWPSSPSKRPSAAVTPSSADSDARNKRLKAIRDALPPAETKPAPMEVDTAHTHIYQKDFPPSPTRPSTSHVNSTTTRPSTNISSARRGRLEEAIKKGLEQAHPPATGNPIDNASTSKGTTYRLEDLGIYLGGSRPSVPNPLPISPDSPANRSFDRGRAHYDDEDEDEAMPGTPNPPSSQEEIANDLLSSPEVVIVSETRRPNKAHLRPNNAETVRDWGVTPDKGKGRAPAQSVADRSQREVQAMLDADERDDEQRNEDEFWTSPNSRRQNGLFQAPATNTTITNNNTASSSSSYHTSLNANHNATASTSTTTPNIPSSSYQPPVPSSSLPSSSQSSSSAGLTATATVATNEEMNADRIDQFIQLNISGMQSIPEYVRKLERKLVAMQRSNESKLRRIKELEDEIKELKGARS